MQRLMSTEEINPAPYEQRPRETNLALFQLQMNFNHAPYEWAEWLKEANPVPFEWLPFDCPMPRDFNPAAFRQLREINPCPVERPREINPAPFEWPRKINPAPLECPLSGPFLDDTYIDNKKRLEILDEIIRGHMKDLLQLENSRKRTNKLREKHNRRIEDLGRHIHLVSKIRRTKHTLQYMSAVTKRMVKKKKVKLPIPRNIRQAVEDSQDNLCKAVQRMQLNLESSVRLSEDTCDNLVAKVDGPSEIAEDLSKLCMKD